MNQRALPTTNESGYYEIRLESIGGLGANLCGKMLGEMGLLYLGLNSASFSSYGSEKTGTPVKAYIRYCRADKDIRVHAPVVKPHMLCVFHEALLLNESVLEGCGKDTILIISTEKNKDQLVDKYFKNHKRCVQTKKVYTIPAQRIAMETKSRKNVVMLGAVVAAMGLGTLEDAKKICEHTLGRKYPDSLAGNLAGVEGGFYGLQEIPGGLFFENNATQSADRLPVTNSEIQPIGGINPWPGNSVINDLSPSRQGYIPIFIPEKCINCGLCDTTCPDMVFQFEKGIYKGREMMVNRGLDYYHCKGCLRCVHVCPSGALVQGVEAEQAQLRHFLPNQDLLRSPDYYEKSGADGYITSESYLTEKREEGGEV